jgi:hypothetical protein
MALLDAALAETREGSGYESAVRRCVDRLRPEAALHPGGTLQVSLQMLFEALRSPLEHRREDVLDALLFARRAWSESRPTTSVHGAPPGT